MMESATVDAGLELQQSATDDLKQIQVEGDCLAICGFAAKLAKPVLAGQSLVPVKLFHTRKKLSRCKPA